MRLVTDTAEDLLHAAKVQADPDLDERARVLERLKVSLVPPEPPPLVLRKSELPRPPESRAAGDRATRAMGKAAPVLPRPLLVSIAALTLFGAGFLLGRVSSRTSSPGAPSVTATMRDVAPVGRTRSVEPEPSRLDAPGRDLQLAPIPVPAPSVPAVVGFPPAPNASATENAPPRTPPPRRTAKSDDTASLQDAVRYLRRAQRALREHDGSRALAILDDMDRRVTITVLTEERQMTRVLAYCESRDPASARELARALLAQHPDSVYVTRLQSTCVPEVAVHAPAESSQ